MVPRRRIFGDFFGSAFPVRHVQYILDLHSKSALRPHHVFPCMVDIQSATADIRRGKKERKKKKPQEENIIT